MLSGCTQQFLAPGAVRPLPGASAALAHRATGVAGVGDQARSDPRVLVDGLVSALMHGDEPRPPVYVLTMHGMITHRPEFSAEWQQKIATAVGLALPAFGPDKTQRAGLVSMDGKGPVVPVRLDRGYEPRVLVRETLSDGQPLPESSIRIRRWGAIRHRGPTIDTVPQLVFYELFWAPLRDHIKYQYLACFELSSRPDANCPDLSSPGSPRPNADIRTGNAVLKDAFLVKGFADAAVVLGAAGDVLRDDVALATCYLARAAAGLSVPEGRCSMTNAQTLAQLGLTALVNAMDVASVPELRRALAQASRTQSFRPMDVTTEALGARTAFTAALAALGDSAAQAAGRRPTGRLDSATFVTARAALTALSRDSAMQAQLQSADARTAASAARALRVRTPLVLASLALNQRAGSRVVAITHSLGSFLLMDAQLAAKGVVSSADSSAMQPSVAPAFAVLNTATVYMFANQVGLLELGRLHVTCDTAGVSSCLPKQRLTSRRTAAAGSSIDLSASRAVPDPAWTTYVAFNDANDLLGFELPPFLASTGLFGPMVNVTVRNGGLLVPPIFKDPGAAHTTHWKNAAIVRAVATGLPADTVENTAQPTATLRIGAAGPALTVLRSAPPGVERFQHRAALALGADVRTPAFRAWPVRLFARTEWLLHERAAWLSSTCPAAECAVPIRTRYHAGGILWKALGAESGFSLLGGAGVRTIQDAERTGRAVHMPPIPTVGLGHVAARYEHRTTYGFLSLESGVYGRGAWRALDWQWSLGWGY